MSLVNVLRSACLFNERKTFTLLFVMIAWPFLMLVILSRLISAAVIIHFLDVQWIVALFVG